MLVSRAMVRIGDDYQAAIDDLDETNRLDDEPISYEDHVDQSRFFVYWIVTKTRRSYIGATVNLERRIRQHNGELVGGARRTRQGSWNYYRIIGGFRTWREALQFEWAFKYISRRSRSISTRNEALEALMKRDRWTRNSPPACDVPLRVYTSVVTALGQ